MTEFDPGVVFRVVDLGGVLANGVLGAAVARQLRLDPVGFVVLALISALGGGLLRDTLLQAGLPVALTDPAYLVTAMAGALAAFVIDFGGRWSSRFLVGVDALALGCWAATGTAKALGVGLGWLPAVLLGVVTAVGGGMIRDIAVGRLPVVFGGNTLYATGALIGSVEMAVLHRLGQQNAGVALAIATCATVSIVARRRGWTLPGPARVTLTLPQRARLSPRARRRARRSAVRPGPVDG